MDNLEKLETNQEKSGKSEVESILGSMPSFEEHMQKLEQDELKNERIELKIWTDFPEEMEGVDERSDVDGVPQTLWRGEKLFKRFTHG